MGRLVSRIFSIALSYQRTVRIRFFPMDHFIWNRFEQFIWCPMFLFTTRIVAPLVTELGWTSKSLNMWSGRCFNLLTLLALHFYRHFYDLPHVALYPNLHKDNLVGSRPRHIPLWTGLEFRSCFLELFIDAGTQYFVLAGKHQDPNRLPLEINIVNFLGL